MQKITIKQRFIRATAIGFAGFAVALAIVAFDGAFRSDWGFVRCATAGAFLAGLMFARGFGGQGGWGWFRAGMAFGAATLLGAILAVMLLPLDAGFMRMGYVSMLGGLPGAGLMGPVYVLGVMADQFLVLAVWGAALAIIQMLSLRKNASLSP